MKQYLDAMKTADAVSRLRLDRRQMLALSAAGVGSAMLARPGHAMAASDKVRTTAHIVIAGAGAAGLSIASGLAARLQGARITLLDARKEHWYQPGFTLVAAGVKAQGYPVSTTAEYVPDGVELIRERVAEIDPEASKVVTASGKSLQYDYLFVATGMVLDYDAIEGMDVSRIGSNGLGSIYHSPASASATWQEMSRFADKGGVGVFLRPDTEMKCAGAPLKYTFIVDDYLSRRGTRSHSQVIYNANNNSLFSVPIVHEKIRMLFEERDIQTQYGRKLTAIDLDRRIARFDTADGPIDLDYDFINVIPPMRAPDVVRNSPLPWQTGKWAEEGWMDVDRGTLRHIRYPNVFGVGISRGFRKGKPPPA